MRFVNASVCVCVHKFLVPFEFECFRMLISVKVLFFLQFVFRGISPRYPKTSSYCSSEKHVHRTYFHFAYLFVVAKHSKQLIIAGFIFFFFRFFCCCCCCRRCWWWCCLHCGMSLLRKSVRDCPVTYSLLVPVSQRRASTGISSNRHRRIGPTDAAHKIK